MIEADEAARAFGGSHPKLITQRENAVYAMMLPEGRAALRLHRRGYQSEIAIRSELWWCGALASRGVPVARPVSTPEGDLLVRLASGQFASAVGWVDGQPLGAEGVPLTGTRDDQAGQYLALGRLLARVHTVTDELEMPPWFTRPRWDVAGLVGDAPFWGRFWEHPAMTPDEARLACKARDFLHERLGDHAARVPLRLIHADVLRENVFAGRNGLSLIDFDDSGFGFALYDLGTALSRNLEEPALPAIAGALIGGYGETREMEAGMVPVFTLMRCWASVGWIMPRLAPGNPIIRRYIDRALGLAATMLAGRDPW